MKRTALLLCALVSLSTAVLIVVIGGLPERANYSEQMLPGEHPTAPEIDAIAPPFEAPVLNGTRFDLVQLHGSPVIVNFWTTWCGPCRVEMPILQALYQQHQEQGLHILAVNLGENEAVVQAWVVEMSLTFNVVLDEQQQIAGLYQLRGVPSTYVLAPNGIISEIFYGPITESQLQTAIAPYVSQPS